MSTDPVRLDRLQAGLFAAVSAVLPSATVVWGPSALPRESATGTLVQLQLIAGPTPTGAPSIQTWMLPMSVRLTVGAVTPGDVLSFAVSGRRWQYAVAGGDTTEDARDGLLAAIGDPVREAMVSATFAADSTDRIQVDALAIGDLYNLRVAGPVTATVLVEQLAMCQLDEADSVIQVQVASTTRDVRTGAHATLARLRHALGLPSSRDALAAMGVSLRIGGAPVIPLDGLSGPVWQSRAATELHARQPVLAAETAGPLIQTVALSLEIHDGDATITEPLSVAEP